VYVGTATGDRADGAPRVRGGNRAVLIAGGTKNVMVVRAAVENGVSQSNGCAQRLEQ
jgi:hypothetical protein